MDTGNSFWEYGRGGSGRACGAENVTVVAPREGSENWTSE